MTSTTSQLDLTLLLSLIDEQIPSAVALRHEIHRDPQLSGHEGPTADAVISALGVVGEQTVAETGRLVRIGPATGPAIGIRAELDALPVREQSGAAFASTTGAMHACGHDVHIAGAVALAKAAMQVDLPVALLFIFQPREESYPSGAKDIVASGLLEAHDVRSVIGVHVHPNVPRGSVTTGAGVVNAASDEFKIVVEGSGGHAAYPHKTADPIVALASIITAAQTIVSRRIDPMHPAVLSFGSVLSGNAANVIPTTAYATGSIRTTNYEDRDLIARELAALVSHVAEAHHCTARLELTSGEPVLRNDPGLVAVVDPLLRAEGFEVIDPMRSCGSDDFSFYSDLYPSLMMFLGTESHREGLSLHSADFCPDDEAVASVARVFAAAYAATAELVAR
ncbi:M20 family metallopeptidase [Leifsonia sp. YAF41]|uniref:M20 metallopeptidase family protein n=1 Tax=Leifsonia sp. YAF41 TaxID=3233086 RepID=UPI003F99A91B